MYVQPRLTTHALLSSAFDMAIVPAGDPLPADCITHSSVVIHTGDPGPWDTGHDMASLTSVTDEVDMDTGEILKPADLDRLMAENLAILAAGHGVSTNQVVTHLHRARCYHAFMDTLIFVKNETAPGNRVAGRLYHDLLTVLGITTTQAYEAARDASRGTPMLLMTIGDDIRAFAGLPDAFDHAALGEMVHQAVLAAGDRRVIDLLEFDVLAS